MDPVVHSAPKAERTLFGGAERLIDKKLAELRGQIGCRLNLSIQDLPPLAERERVHGVLEELYKVPELSGISDKLQCVLQDIHQALLAHTLSDRDSAFRKAITLLESSETLQRALRVGYEFPDEIADYEDAVRVSHCELSFATQSLRDLTWWARYGHFHQSEQVAIYLARAHRWVFGAGQFLL